MGKITPKDQRQGWKCLNRASASKKRLSHRAAVKVD